jgi:hypothetical protein
VGVAVAVEGAQASRRSRRRRGGRRRRADGWGWRGRWWRRRGRRRRRRRGRRFRNDGRGGRRRRRRRRRRGRRGRDRRRRRRRRRGRERGGGGGGGGGGGVCTRELETLSGAVEASLAGDGVRAAIRVAAFRFPPPPERLGGAARTNTWTSTRSRMSLISRTIAGLTVVAEMVSAPPSRPLLPSPFCPLPPAAIVEPKTTSSAGPFPPPVLESSAKIGRPIVSHISVTSGRASATGAKRVRRSSTARGAGSRRGRAMYECRMSFLRRSAAGTAQAN